MTGPALIRHQVRIGLSVIAETAANHRRIAYRNAVPTRLRRFKQRFSFFIGPDAVLQRCLAHHDSRIRLIGRPVGSVIDVSRLFVRLHNGRCHRIAARPVIEHGRNAINGFRNDFLAAAARDAPGTDQQDCSKRKKRQKTKSFHRISSPVCTASSAALPAIAAAKEFAL